MSLCCDAYAGDREYTYTSFPSETANSNKSNSYRKPSVPSWALRTEFIKRIRRLLTTSIKHLQRMKKYAQQETVLSGAEASQGSYLEGEGVLGKVLEGFGDCGDKISISVGVPVYSRHCCVRFSHPLCKPQGHSAMGLLSYPRGVTARPEAMHS